MQEIPQTETTPFYPRSPYGVAKQFGYWMLINYREVRAGFAESPQRFGVIAAARAVEVARKVGTPERAHCCLVIDAG